jgi:hypothetical protein
MDRAAAMVLGDLPALLSKTYGAQVRLYDHYFPCACATLTRLDLFSLLVPPSSSQTIIVGSEIRYSTTRNTCLHILHTIAADMRASSWHGSRIYGSRA